MRLEKFLQFVNLLSHRGRLEVNVAEGYSILGLRSVTDDHRGGEFICKLLGAKILNAYGHGPERFDDGAIAIEGFSDETPTHTGRVTVRYRGAVVFEVIDEWDCYHQIKSYIPGEWDLVDKYYPQAMIIAQQRRAEAMAKERARDEEEKKKWGL